MLTVYILIFLVISLMVYYECSWRDMIIVSAISASFIYAYTSIIYKDRHIDQVFREHNLPNLYKDVDGYDFKSIGNISTLYGEILTQGVKSIYDFANMKNIDTFIDIGCGVGKAVVIGKLLGFNNTIGVEIVKSRYDGAMTVYNKLPNKHKQGITFINADMFNINFQELTQGRPCIIFASNLIWNKNISTKFFKMVANTYESSTVYVIASVFNPDSETRARFKQIGTLNTPMSWDHNAVCYVIKLI